MLKDGNAAANNIYNESINEGAYNGMSNAIDLDTTNGITTAGGRDSRNSSTMPGFGPRASSGNLSNKILDKRFNKMLFNMHGIPVKPNVINQQNNNNKKDSKYPQMSADLFQQPNQLSSAAPPKAKGNRKRKTQQNIVEQNV
jgi:hypothetical protein